MQLCACGREQEKKQPQQAFTVLHQKPPDKGQGPNPTPLCLALYCSCSGTCIRTAVQWDRTPCRSSWGFALCLGELSGQEPACSIRMGSTTLAAAAALAGIPSISQVPSSQRPRPQALIQVKLFPFSLETLSGFASCKGNNKSERRKQIFSNDYMSKANLILPVTGVRGRHSFPCQGIFVTSSPLMGWATPSDFVPRS